MRVVRGYQPLDCVHTGARARMIDLNHPVLSELGRRGFNIALHTYVRGEKINANVAAKHPDSGQLLQGWSKTGSEDEALYDLARRAARDLG